MSNPRKTLFISDLHLEESRPDIIRQFSQLLESCDQSVDALYILGDLFEAWIGDDDDSSFHTDIIQALKSVTSQGISIYFMRGNRDFLIGRKFMQATGCKLLPDEKKIMLYNTPVLLIHGDTLCTRDISYLKWRKFARNPILHTLFFLILPLTLRRKFAQKMRDKSAKHTRTVTEEIMDVTPDAVVNVMQKHNVQTLIHGHTHKPFIHHLTVNNSPATRIVLAAWHQQGSVLVWQENGEKHLVALS